MSGLYTCFCGAEQWRGERAVARLEAEELPALLLPTHGHRGPGTCG